jgi:hypothetical protein
VLRSRSRGAEIKFPAVAGAEITYYGPGSVSLPLYQKAWKNYVEKSHGCINQRKKVGTQVKEGKF